MNPLRYFLGWAMLTTQDSPYYFDWTCGDATTAFDSTRSRKLIIENDTTPGRSHRLQRFQIVMGCSRSTLDTLMAACPALHPHLRYDTRRYSPETTQSLLLLATLHPSHLSFSTCQEITQKGIRINIVPQIPSPAMMFGLSFQTPWIQGF